MDGDADRCALGIHTKSWSQVYLYGQESARPTRYLTAIQFSLQCLSQLYLTTPWNFAILISGCLSFPPIDLRFGSCASSSAFSVRSQADFTVSGVTNHIRVNKWHG